MLCNKCFEKIKELLIDTENNGYKCKSISAVPSGQLVLTNNFFPLHITTEKEITRGKKKGQLKKEESVHYFKSHFCPKCGTEFGDKESEKK